MSSPIIRPATAADRADIIELVKDFYYARGFNRPDGPTGIYVEPDEALAHRYVDVHFSDANSCCIVFEIDGVARGVLMATVNYFGRSKFADETIWWVDPDYRRMDSLKMIDAYEAWAREKGCVGSAMNEFVDVPVGAIYRRKGYRPLETKHVKTF